LTRTGESPNGPSKSELKKRAKEAEKQRKAAEKAAKQEELAKQKAAADMVLLYIDCQCVSSDQPRYLQDFASESYGPLPLNQSQSRPRQIQTLISSLSSSVDNKHVIFRARVQTSRAQGNKMVFLNLRQRTDSVQALLTVEPEKVSKQMVKWAAGLADESIVRVEGVVRKSPELIKSASVQDVEVHITKV
jgi:hypothetical protein